MVITFADKLSLLRILLIPVFVSLLMYSQSDDRLRYFALGVFIAAVLTDFFDGLAARIRKDKSRIGKVLDPLADKLLLLTAFVCLYALDFRIPLWLVLIVVSRDLIILLGVMILNFLKVEIAIAPSMWGKLTTFFQMLTVMLILLGQDAKFMQFVWLGTVLFTVISGIGYFVRGVSLVQKAQ